MTRLMIAALVAASTVSVAAAPADAKSKRTRYYAPPQNERVVVRENPDSADCVRARSLDPAGNYRGYPCWARAALSGNPRR